MYTTGTLDAAGVFGSCEDCLKSAAHGDNEALTKLYVTLRRPVFLLAYSILGDYALAEDVTQETFLRIAEKASDYKPGTNPKAWIFTIARNLALSCLRKRSHEEISETEPKLTAESAEDTALTDSGFARALSVLNADEREIVTLKIAVGFKHREIAEIMNISPGDARVKYFRSLKKLKKHYVADK